MALSPETIETEILQNALIHLGNYYALDRCIDMHHMERELVEFKNDWKHYNPRKPHIPRQGLSLTSLDGGMSGIPDLDSLPEYNALNGTKYGEESFRVPTKAFEKITALSGPLEDFTPHMGRSHLLRLHSGGFFPFHRDAQHLGNGTFRVIAQLTNTEESQFCFLYDRQRIILEPNQLYFLNTKIDHALFSFGNNATLLVMNMIISEAAVNVITHNLLSK